MAESFRFLHPQWLAMLLPLAALLWAVRSAGGSDSGWRRVVDAHLLPHLTVRGDGRRRRWPLALLGLGWLLAVLALADPAWDRRPVPLFRAETARVVILDLSRSMLAPDLTPSRLARARYKVSDILDRSGEGQVALVAFAGEAFTVSPLTEDSDTVGSLLSVLEPDIMPVQGSRPDLGIRKALELIRQAALPGGEALLITDDAGGARVLAAAREARRAGVRVSVLGVGTPQGAPIPGVRDDDGRPVLATLDAGALKAVAAAGGGHYATISSTDGDLDTVLVNHGPGGAGDYSMTDMSSDVWQERGPWLVLALLPLAALAFRRGWLLVLPAVVIGQLAVPGDAVALGWDDLWKRQDQQAAEALAEGDNERAAQLAVDPQRRGSALFRAGSFDQAVEAFEQSQDAEARYNLGNALARQGRYEEALAAYDEALKARPALEDARYNRDLVEQLLKQQQQQEKGAGEDGDEGEPQGSAADSDGAGQDGEDESGVGQDGDQGAGDNGARQQGDDDSGAPPGAGRDAGEAAAGNDDDDPAAGQEGVADSADDVAQQRAAEQSRGGGDAQAGASDTSESPGPDDEGSDDTEAGRHAAMDDDDLDPEQRQALEQWLRRIPDDPGGLLRRKFLYQYRQRAASQAPGPPW